MKKRKQKFLLICIFAFFYLINAKSNDERDSEESAEEEEEETTPAEMETYKYLIKRLKQSAVENKLAARQRVVARPYAIPGPFEPLPGRSHNGDYWPVFPFSNQYSGAVDLDPSISRHIGGDINIPVPSWGMLDITGRFFNRIHDTTTKFGYLNHPVNMLGLSKEDFATLVSDPRLAANRYLHPTIPLGKVAKSTVPINCKPPMCNPYTGTFALGIEHDWGGHDGNEGDINVPIPVSKGVAYRFPFGGNYYYDRDNLTITYGHNLSPIDPYANPYIFNNDYTRRRELLPPEPNVYPRRQKRSIIGFAPIYSEEINEPRTDSQKVTAKDFKSHQPMQNLRKIMNNQKSVFWGQPKVRQKLANAIEPAFYMDYQNTQNLKQMRLKVGNEIIPLEAFNSMFNKMGPYPDSENSNLQAFYHSNDLMYQNQMYEKTLLQMNQYYHQQMQPLMYNNYMQPFNYNPQIQLFEHPMFDERVMQNYQYHMQQMIAAPIMCNSNNNFPIIC